MSIFGNIMSAIFGHSAQAQGAGQAQSGAPQGAQATSPSTVPGQAPQQNVDVEAILTEKAKQKREKLDWRHSIVDLMKLLDLDSSLAARKQLAQELHFTGDTNDSASMNIWLQKQVMQKLAANGGKVPADLTH
jgi:Domain of unknown function (DUF3597)